MSNGQHTQSPLGDSKSDVFSEEDILFNDLKTLMENEATLVPKQYARRHFLRNLLIMGVASGSITSTNAILEAQQVASNSALRLPQLPDRLCIVFSKTGCMTNNKQGICSNLGFKVDINCNAGIGGIKIECGNQSKTNECNGPQGQKECNFGIKVNDCNAPGANKQCVLPGSKIDICIGAGSKVEPCSSKTPEA